MEHRWGDRRKIILRVRLRGSGQATASGWLTDLSLSGAYVRTLAALAPMGQIEIELIERASSHHGHGPVQLQARVVRHGLTGIGVEWDEFASGAVGEILRNARSGQRHGASPTPGRVRGPQLWAPAALGAATGTPSYPEP